MRRSISLLSLPFRSGVAVHDQVVAAGNLAGQLQNGPEVGPRGGPPSNC